MRKSIIQRIAAGVYFAANTGAGSGGGTTDEALVDDIFSTAFDEAIAEPEAKLEPEPEKEPEPAAEPEPVKEPEAKVEPEPVKEPEKAPAAITPEDVTKAVKDALAAAKPAEEAKVEPEEVDPPEVVAALKDLEEQWPTHKVAVSALVEKALKQQAKVLTENFTKTVEELKNQFAPVVQTVQNDAESKHLATITAAHPDAQTIVPDVEKWIATQPAYLQPAYNRVLDEGAATDIIDLFTQFKTATGRTTPAAKEEPKVDESRLRRMETPATVRTSVTAESEPDDFDSAFEAELKKFKPAA